MIRRLLVVTALLLASVGLAPTASAVPGAPGSLTTTDGVLFQTCVRHPFSYAATPGSSNWRLLLSSRRSDGTAGPYVSLSSALGAAATGSDTLDFCGYGDTAGTFLPGAYTLSGELTWVDGAGTTQTEQLPPVAFTMAKPATRTRLRLSDRTPVAGQPLTFRVSVQVQSPTGWMRLPDDVAPLRLRVLGRGPGDRRFTPLRGVSGVYDYGGTWSRKVRWLGTLPRAQFRAQTRGNDFLADSLSTTVRLTTAH